MKDKLLKLLENSYSPYSKFRVAAIAVMKDGKEFCGVNVENASYGVSNCAERSAIFSAISNGYKRYDFEELHVMCDSDKLGTCCFVCRQVISEMFEKDKRVTWYTRDGEYKEFSVEELCPYPFSDDNLE